MKKWMREGITGKYVWGNVAVNKCALILFEKSKKTCQLNNEKIRWVWVTYTKKDTIIWTYNKEKYQSSREVKVHFMFRK